jgi:hypothetical protein
MATRANDGVIAAHFPAAGIDLSDAFARQPSREVLTGFYARTTPSAINVLAYDTQGDRLRGGSRPGLARVGPRVLNYLIQWLGQTITDDDDVQSSISGRVVHRFAIANGSLYSIRPGETEWIVATDNATATPPLNESGIMQSASNIQREYFADGVNWTYWDPDTNSMEDWTASTAGTLPIDEDNNKPRLICTWRGRTLLSGLLRDGQSIFASAIDDPHDWDYGRVTFGVDQAWALTTGEQGFVGDKVTGLCPYNDDTLIIFGERSIQVLQGDPTDGGRRTFITDSIGAMWGKAWCRGPQGEIYFVSNDFKIYVMAPGSKPVPISQPIEQLIQDRNTGELNVVCGYDYRSQAIHFFISPLAEPGATRHLTLELRPRAWSELVFANTLHDPLCCAIFDGNEADDRGLFFGSWDGYVRRFDYTAEDDDGTPIESEVVIGPFLTPTLDEVFVSELQGELGEESGSVYFDVFVGRTAEAALASDAVYTGSMSAGRNLTFPVRRAGHAIYVKIRSQNKWAMERIRLVIATHGLVRQRGR